MPAAAVGIAASLAVSTTAERMRRRRVTTPARRIRWPLSLIA